MDTFAEALDKAPQPTTREPCKLFADDVKLSAMTAGGLQHSLDLASTWAMENGMKWNTKKSMILRSKETQRTKCFLVRDQAENASRSEIPRRNNYQ